MKVLVLSTKRKVIGDFLLESMDQLEPEARRYLKFGNATQDSIFIAGDEVWIFVEDNGALKLEINDSLTLKWREQQSKRNFFAKSVFCVAGSWIILIFALLGCRYLWWLSTAPSLPRVEDMEVPSKLPELTNSLGMEFKLIPAATFTMGDRTGREQWTRHNVTLTQPCQMGVHEVTQAQYEQVMGVNPSYFKGADNPVNNVSWEDAVEFCRKLSELPVEKGAGNVYRLPTEAEWEYACRAGTTTKYSFGNDESELGDTAWYAENSGNKPHPVGSKQPNAWGLYDMHGNVGEWCQDWLANYPETYNTYNPNPTGPATGSLRVFRGGGWRSPAISCKSGSRFRDLPSSHDGSLGFRVCLSDLPPFPP